MREARRRYTAWRRRCFEEAKASGHFSFRSKLAEEIYRWATWRGSLLLFVIAIAVVIGLPSLAAVGDAPPHAPAHPRAVVAEQRRDAAPVRRLDDVDAHAVGSPPSGAGAGCPAGRWRRQRARRSSARAERVDAFPVHPERTSSAQAGDAWTGFVSPFEGLGQHTAEPGSTPTIVAVERSGWRGTKAAH